MPDVRMPRLSDSMEEGTILKWLKADGDEVRPGDELVEIETDKANMTYEAEAGGVLAIAASEGDTLPVGELIARLGEGAAADAAGAAAEPAAEEPAEPAAEAAEEAEPPQPAEAPAVRSAAVAGNGGSATKASPVARRMARELGVELAGVTGSGPGGRIVKADVESLGGVAPARPAPPAAPAPAPPPAAAPAAGAGSSGTAKGDVTRQELSRLQQTVARRMAESKATAPEFVIALEADMEAAVALRAQLKDFAEPVPSYNDLVVKAAALALREFPRANGSYRDGRFELFSRVNVGIAVAAQDALVVPTVFDADRKGLGTIAVETRALAERVRTGAVTPPELSGGTFTVSNLGMYGMRRIVPVINPPQAAILGVGALEPRAVVRDGQVDVRHMMDLTLVCDHRILYGADAAQFLARIRELLEQPLRLVL
ncbi:MAG TPA: dihydrolipoamide acetyltransferase family protein [Solirubrobacteraceae bacterium]|nr:dihydrolipoamide acetyltransferase family protein [Solirubrobacteraceae bacterium]